jgi:PAS domain S-box-containing protein
MMRASQRFPSPGFDMAPYNSSLDATAWLAAIVESSDDAIVSKDLNGIVTSWNLGAERIFGYHAHEIIGQPILKLIPPERHSEEDYILGQVRRGESIKQYDTQRQCKDGRLIHVSLTISPIRNQSNEIVGVSKIARDITERKIAQETQTLLLRELNHRSKNLLAVADAIVRQTAKSTSPREFVERISRRLHALSINQDLMIEHDWRGADIAQVVQWQLASIVDDSTRRVVVEGYPCVVTPRVAQALGLAIYELATNALKFGALSSPAGKIHIKWQVAEANGTREFKLSWQESGGPPVIRPRKKGFGSAITESMVARSVLGSVTVTYAPAGLIWELVAPEAGLTETTGSSVIS